MFFFYVVKYITEDVYSYNINQSLINTILLCTMCVIAKYYSLKY